MHDRVGALHLRYRVPRAGSAAAAVPPALDRAVRSGLARALEERLSAVLGSDASVVVIRELDSKVALSRSDWSLDGRTVDRICRSSVDAVAELLARSPPDGVVRFASEAEFVGAFIVELVGGSAWERWWFGAFQRFRRDDVRATIEAVLEQSGVEPSRVVGWLARRGHLEAVLAVLHPATARRLVTGAAAAPGAGVAPDVAPLAAAAFRLLAPLGLAPDGFEGERSCLARFLATGPLAPSWSDRRSLSVWVQELVRFAAAESRAAARTPPAADWHAVEALLHGSLDWLDATWLAARLAEVAGPSSPPGTPVGGVQRRVVTPAHERALAHIAESLRSGRIRVDRDRDDDAAVVRLVAAAEEAAGAIPARSVVAAIEGIVDAWRAAIGDAIDREHALAAVERAAAGVAQRATPAGAETTRRLERLRAAAGPAAVDVVRALVATTPFAADGAVETRGAALFLLTRAVLDVRLGSLARERGVPLAPLLGALAMKWLGLVPPFDGPTALWTGAERPDLASLEAGGARLPELAADVLQVLVEQRVLDTGSAADGVAADAAGFPALDAGASADRALAEIAAAVLRAWARWLPGLGGAGPRFLRERCLERAGRVRATREVIEVELEPAPLDVVLEMAGYLRRIESVPWLDRRPVTFSIRRGARA